MPYRLQEIELSRPPEPIRLAPDEDGVGLICRWKGRLVGFHLEAAPKGSELSIGAQAAIVEPEIAVRALAAELENELAATRPVAPVTRAPSLSVAICTKDRPERLARLLASLNEARARPGGFAVVEVVVVDNAPSDGRTRAAVEAAAWPRYVLEPRPGLDFARNAALGSAKGRLIAYLDDDVVVDRGWFEGLFAVWSAYPEAGGFTGLVLPFELRTRAQVAFEEGGGFRRGFVRKAHSADLHGMSNYPAGAGIFGAGCNMAFDRKLLLSLGGFDEALDTGAPLPGGGDLDIFYRVVRAGRLLVYDPDYCVYHQHRETMAQLRRQYETWGRGFMAFLVKSMRHDPALELVHGKMLRWWFVHAVWTLAAALRRFRIDKIGFAAAELRGGIVGFHGEYDRSLRRIARILEQSA